MIRKLLTKLVIAKHLPKNPYPGEMLANREWLRIAADHA